MRSALTSADRSDRRINVDRKKGPKKKKSVFFFFQAEDGIRDLYVTEVQTCALPICFYLNRNGLTGVYSDTQYYFVNLLAASRTFVSFITSQKLKSALTSYFPSGCRLKALRYYETYGGHHMQWHTDNKTARGFAEIPGLIFIFYCEDVVDGEFQYIRGSHKWSGEQGFNDYSDEYISKNHGDEIVKFAGPAG